MRQADVLVNESLLGAELDMEANGHKFSLIQMSRWSNWGLGLSVRGIVQQRVGAYLPAALQVPLPSAAQSRFNEQSSIQRPTGTRSRRETVEALLDRVEL